MRLPPAPKMKSISAIKPCQTMRGHTHWVTGVVQLPDGRWIITCSSDGSLRLWNLESGVQIGNDWRDDEEEPLRSITLSPNGKTVASGSMYGTIRLWDIETKKVVARWSGHTDVLGSLCWSVDGKRVVSGSSDGAMRVWDVESGDTVLGPIKTGHQGVDAVIYSPDTTKIATGGYNENALKIWDAMTGNLLSTIKHDFEVWSVAWTSDQKKLITGDHDGGIRIFDTATWQQIAILEGHTNGVCALSLFQNNRLLASGSPDKTARLWDLDTNLPVGPRLQHEDVILCVAVSADGKLLVTGGRDGKACVWDIHTNGDAAFAAGNCEMAIDLYSATIDLDPTNASILANRCNAELETKQWKEALADAQKVIELDPSSYLGYNLKYAALHGAEQYDEANMVFDAMLSKLDDTPDMEIRKLRGQYISSSEVAAAIQKVIHTRLDNIPHRLFNTFTGRLCDRGAQINAFKRSKEYIELLSSSTEDADIRMQHIERAVAMYFSYSMLSHRWEEKEPLLQDVQDEVVCRLKYSRGVAKLQAFCKTARDAGHRWAWIDTCCIDQTNNVEVQKSVNSMFVWYRNSALTIVYLLDVPPSSKSGALARSVWNERGWTVQEFLAPNVVLFYQNDWTPYLGDRSPNHKESSAIMQELAGATGIDPQALIAFRPEMKGAREKLQWVSARVTTLQEDMAYSLFGIFGIHLPVIYGENKQNALGRLLQEIVARSGDISALDWVGRPSEFNSCLPADISSYKALPHTLPSLSEDQIQASISSLRNVVAVDLASKLYNLLESQSVPRFANCRLQLPCIVFHVTEIRRSRARDQKIAYEVKANGLIDLLITTEDEVPTRQTLLLIYPWNRYLLESPNAADDIQIVDDHYVTDATGKDELSDTKSRRRFIHRVRKPISAFFNSFARPVDSESHLRAVRLIVRVGQPFRAFLLAQQRGGGYRRIASDHDIIAQIQDVTSLRKMSDVRIIEIL